MILSILESFLFNFMDYFKNHHWCYEACIKNYILGKIEYQISQKVNTTTETNLNYWFPGAWFQVIALPSRDIGLCLLPKYLKSNKLNKVKVFFIFQNFFKPIKY